MSKLEQLAAKLDNYDALAREVGELRDRLASALADLEAEQDRCRNLTRNYSNMRTKLDMAFGAPDGPDRVERGRNAGLQGAVDWAIAEHARVLREGKA